MAVCRHFAAAAFNERCRLTAATYDRAKEKGPAWTKFQHRAGNQRSPHNTGRLAAPQLMVRKQMNISLTADRPCDDAGFLAYLNSEAGQARFAKWMRAISPHIDRGERFTDAGSASFLSTLQRQARWSIFPYGEYWAPDGSSVIFDGKHRPIARVFEDGHLEIVPSDAYILHTHRKFYHDGFGPSPDPETREIAIGIMTRYGLEPELRRRRELQRGGFRLPRWSGVKGEA